MSIELTTGGRGDHRGSSQELTAVRHPEIVANEEFSSSLLTRAPPARPFTCLALYPQVYTSEGVFAGIRLWPGAERGSFFIQLRE